MTTQYYVHETDKCLTKALFKRLYFPFGHLRSASILRNQKIIIGLDSLSVQSLIYLAPFGLYCLFLSILLKDAKLQ